MSEFGPKIGDRVQAGIVQSGGRSSVGSMRVCVCVQDAFVVRSGLQGSRRPKGLDMAGLLFWPKVRAPGADLDPMKACCTLVSSDCRVIFGWL